MPATGTLADPDCDVCGGTGTDPVFFGDCSECWPLRRHARQHEEFWHARRQAALIPPAPPRPRPRCCECGLPVMQYRPVDHPDDYAKRCELHYWLHEAEGWAAKQPQTPTTRMWAAKAQRKAALIPRRTTSRQPSH